MGFAFTGPHLVMPTLPSTHPEYYQPSSSPFPIPILKTIINAKVLLSANVVPLIHLIGNFHKEVYMLRKVFSKPFLAQSSGCLPWLHGKITQKKLKRLMNGTQATMIKLLSSFVKSYHGVLLQQEVENCRTQRTSQGRNVQTIAGGQGAFIQVLTSFHHSYSPIQSLKNREQLGKWERSEHLDIAFWWE